MEFVNGKDYCIYEMENKKMFETTNQLGSFGVAKVCLDDLNSQSSSKMSSELELRSPFTYHLLIRDAPWDDPPGTLR
jgi:hypothetical protein